jgi:hypothetical protein
MFNADNTQPVLEMGETQPGLEGLAWKSLHAQLANRGYNCRQDSNQSRRNFTLLSINSLLQTGHYSRGCTSGERLPTIFST